MEPKQGNYDPEHCGECFNAKYCKGKISVEEWQAELRKAGKAPGFVYEAFGMSKEDFNIKRKAMIHEFMSLLSQSREEGKVAVAKMVSVWLQEGSDEDKTFKVYCLINILEKMVYDNQVEKLLAAEPLGSLGIGLISLDVSDIKKTLERLDQTSREAEDEMPIL